MKIIKNNKGTTMVETLVAFVILIIILGMIYGIIHFCSIMRLNAEDMNKKINTFSGEIYSNDIDSNKIEVNTFENSDENINFALHLDNRNTSTSNNYIDTTFEMNNIKVKSFKYKTDTDDLVPAAAHFERRSE